MSIPISPREPEDKLSWAFSRDGTYTVKTAYMLGKGCDLDAFHQVWVSIWRLETTPKVKHFLWRMCTNSLPTCSLLYYRHMRDSDKCPWCSNSPETLHHTFFSCPTVHDLWNQCECADLFVEDPNFDCKETILHWANGDAKKCRTGVALLWQIWNHRNQYIFNETEVPYLIGQDRVVRLVEDCGNYASKIYCTARKNVNKSPNRWLPPSLDFVKINCDASLKTDGWIGLGAIARNAAGEVLFAGARRCRGYWPPEIAECKALHFVVKLALRYGYKNVIMESDCQMVVSHLSKADTFFSDLDNVLDDIFFLSSNFNFVFWSHVKRDGNYVAHHLASLVPFGDEQVWVNSYPSVIFPYVLMDKLSINE